MKGLCNMGKIGIKKAGILLIAVMAVSLFAGCRRSRNGEMKKVVDLLTDTSIMDRYMESVEDYERVEYERVTFTAGIFDGIGPHDFRFRGIVYLTDDEAERLWNEYEWEEIPAPEFEFDKVDDSVIGEGPWYSSNDFIKDNYKTVNVYYAVFDGENLVFDINQI